MLLDRILELEAAVARQPSSPTPHSPNSQTPSQPPTAFPRALQSSHALNAFQAILHEALDEVRTDDPSLDPLYSSRHIGPQARKRQLEEMKEREEEEARDARKTPRRGKATATAPNSTKAKEAGVPSPFPPPANSVNPTSTAPGSSQTLVTSSGKRIRIKPPSAASSEPVVPPPSSGHGMHRIPQFINNAGVPPTPYQLSPGSPMSPLGSDTEHYAGPDGDSSHPLRNGNGNGTPNHIGPGSPTSVGPSATSIPQTTVQRHTKPKRLKAHTVTSKSYSIPMVPRDKNGRPILPLNVGIMTVNCLGEVCMREHFHTERYIFPVGYSVNR
jgi:F/Y-rich N-terminus